MQDKVYSFTICSTAILIIELIKFLLVQIFILTNVVILRYSVAICRIIFFLGLPQLSFFSENVFALYNCTIYCTYIFESNKFICITKNIYSVAIFLPTNRNDFF